MMTMAPFVSNLDTATTGAERIHTPLTHRRHFDCAGLSRAFPPAARGGDLSACVHAQAGASPTLRVLAFPVARNPRTGQSCKGFSLLELLIVIGVISILLGMLLTAIRTVTQHTRRTIARAEVRMLEGAWKQYFTHYQRWPTNEVFQQVFPITADIAKGLEGRIETLPAELSGFNPEGVAFMEFTRYNQDRAPISPAQTTIVHSGLPAPHTAPDAPLDGRMFFCRLNILEEETLAIPGGTDDQAVPRDVIVWTYDERFPRDPDNPRFIIGSWQQ